MKTKFLLMFVAVAILAMAIGQAQAITVDVPNGDFETMYKPGSTTITAALDSGEWFKANSTNQGFNCELQQDGIADYSDGTTGTFVDFPDWTFNVGSSDVMMGGAWGGVGGGMGLGVFTGWGGATQVESANPLNMPAGGPAYTLSAEVYWTGRPINLDLKVDGVIVTPDSSVSPPDPGDGSWVTMTRNYASIPAGVVTIQFGTLDIDETGNRASIDNVTLDYEFIGPSNPSPADGATVPVGDVDLSWTNLDPNVGDITYVDVWFGTEPNESHPGYDMVQVVTADPDRNTWTVNAPTPGTYYWQVVNYIYGPDNINEPNALVGPAWSFIAVEDVAPTVVIDTPDQITWSGQPVPLAATVTDDGVSALTILWTADPADGVVFDDDTAEDTNVTITKATDNPSTVTLTLAVSDVGNPTTPDTDTMEIDVYDDACKAAIGAGATYDQTDFDENCITDLRDFAVIAAAWLDNYAETGPVPK